MGIVIIKYNAGNIFSVDSAMKRLNVDAIVTDDVELIRTADKVIFPGVGEASTTMNYLRNTGLDKVIKDLTQPVLGICLGMQLMCKHSEEGNVDCLNIFDVDVKRFISQKHEDKIPHMGWNTITDVKNPLFDTSLENQYVYFVHSYYVPINSNTVATTDYILPFSAALHTENFYATQFHPEKSGSVGEYILTNFLKL
uniref:imidazole glycerol phosphate synthase subunit HisH n=1 Tax=uncultured Dysgonomonas sp. TaxID=206096 RepID=UPI0026110F65|nr:imidazole glycerol phosphate synthase subunit HisH [uncultured Dysgonomonas sp.]